MDGHAKTAIVNAATEQGHTDSYGALLYLTACMEFDPKALVPESEEENSTWRGHMLGLRSALHCLAMHEQQYGPSSTGPIVDQHIDQAVAVLKRLAAGTDG